MACHVQHHLCSCVPARSASSGRRSPRLATRRCPRSASRTPDMRRQLLLFGTADVDFATFEYLRSPASAFVLAWHSLFFLGDPLNAAMPALIMVAALAGTVTVRLVRSLFGLSWRAAMAVAAIAVCAPMFRWALATYSLGELLSATLGALPHRRRLVEPLPRVPTMARFCSALGRAERCCFSVRVQRSARPAASHAALSKRFTTFRLWPCSACQTDCRGRQAPDVLRSGCARGHTVRSLSCGLRQCGHFAGRHCLTGSAHLQIASWRALSSSTWQPASSSGTSQCRPPQSPGRHAGQPDGAS